jgi:hypothetical protein
MVMELSRYRRVQRHMRTPCHLSTCILSIAVLRRVHTCLHTLGMLAGAEHTLELYLQGEERARPAVFSW